MKDIDFDELDRAVSSLMRTTPSDDMTDTTDTTETPSDSNTESVKTDESNQDTAPAVDVHTPSISSENELSQTKEPEDISSLDTIQPAASATPVARRGRFMDVMRPSTRDTKKSSSFGSISREGTSLRPMSDAVKPETSSLEVPSEQSNDSESMAPEVNPFDFSKGLESPTESEEPTPESISESMPLSSPFLPDAKVEKRPLGRPADAPAMTDSVVAPTESMDGASTEVPTVDKDAQLPEQPLPPELDSKLLSIETGGENVLTETQPMSSPAIEAQPAASQPTPASVSVASIAATSIPEQYKVQPQKNDEAPASAIYDTQPLAHPAKKSPGWLWIVGIVAVLLLGIGGGAAVYYLGLL